MIIRKWSDKDHKYYPYKVPDDWYISVSEFDMEYKVNCVNCGKVISFGDGYTSLRYHTEQGFGYAECESCYFEYYKTICGGTL